MHGRYSLFTVAASLLLGACASEVAPLPDESSELREIDGNLEVSLEE